MGFIHQPNGRKRIVFQHLVECCLGPVHFIRADLLSTKRTIGIIKNEYRFAIARQQLAGQEITVPTLIRAQQAMIQVCRLDLEPRRFDLACERPGKLCFANTGYAMQQDIRTLVTTFQRTP